MTDPAVIPFRRTIEETVVEGKRLGRHVHHDPRSLSYLIQPDGGTVASARWTRGVPVFDQGNYGSCTGNALVGALGTDPFFASLITQRTAGLNLDEAEAQTIYSDAEVIDGDGPFPPNDNGSSGLSVAKAAKNAGLISGYQHITSVAAAQTAIQKTPFIVGSDWHVSMDSPDSSGLVVATGAVRGGHEYECYGYDAQADLWWFCNSWGLGWGVGGRFCYSSITFAKLLAAQGDATVLVPISVPAPVPTPPTPTPTPPAPTPTPDPTPLPIPVPPAPPGPGATFQVDPAVGARVARAAARESMTPDEWLDNHLEHYFHLIDLADELSLARFFGAG